METEVAQSVLQALEKLDERFERIARRLAALEHRVGDINTRLKSWPDMHYLCALAKAQLQEMITE